jgi:hypothetical protein
MSVFHRFRDGWVEVRGNRVTVWSQQDDADTMEPVFDDSADEQARPRSRRRPISRSRPGGRQLHLGIG